MKVLLTDSVHNCLVEGLSEMGFFCDLKEGLPKNKVLEIIKDYEAIVVNSRLRLDREFFDAAKRLKFVARTGSGMEIIDQGYALENGVACFSSPEGNCNAVGEHALGMLLALLNKMHKGHNEVLSEVWRREDNRGVELDGKTIALIGYGHTAKAFARKLRGFDVEVLAYDKYIKGFSSHYVKESELEEIYTKADIVSLHLPLTQEVLFWLNRDRIRRFEKAFYLINTSRGKVVKTTDLIEALEQKKILGAGLDVFENERFDRYKEKDWQWYYALKRQANVLLTPHVAGWTLESKYKLAKVLLEKVKGHFKNGF